MAQEWPHRSRLLLRRPRAAGQPIIGGAGATDGTAERATETTRTSGSFPTDSSAGSGGSERPDIPTSTSVGHVWAQPTAPHQPKPRIDGIVVDRPVRNRAAAVPAAERATDAIIGEDAMYNIAAIPSGDPAIETNAFGHPEYLVAPFAENDTADIEGPAQHWSRDAQVPVRRVRRLLERH